jgi:hypothetical protein
MEPLLFGIGLFVFVGVLCYALKTSANRSTQPVQEFQEAREEV